MTKFLPPPWRNFELALFAFLAPRHGYAELWYLGRHEARFSELLGKEISIGTRSHVSATEGSRMKLFVGLER